MNNYQDLIIKEKIKLNIFHPIKLIKDKIEKNRIKKEKLRKKQIIYKEWVKKLENPKNINFQEQCYNSFLNNEKNYPKALIFKADSIEKYNLNNIEELAEGITIMLYNDKYNLLDLKYINQNILSDLNYLRQYRKTKEINDYIFIYEQILDKLKKDNITFDFKLSEFEEVCIKKKNQKVNFIKSLIICAIVTIVFIVCIQVLK